MRRPLILFLAAVLLVGGAVAPAATLGTNPVASPPPGSVITESGRVLPPPPDGLELPSVHAEMLAAEGSQPTHFTPGGAPTILLDAAGNPKLSGAAMEPMGTIAAAGSGLPNGLRKEVLGFLPYWMLDDTSLSSMNYSLVSTIAYFSVNAKRDGSLVKGTSSGWAGWNSAAMTEVIDRAHANGVRVVLTVTMMAWDSTSAAHQQTLLTTGSYRRRLVNQIVNAVSARGADGVNLDFEPLASSLRDEYVSFVRLLKKGLTDAGVGSNLTVCVMASAATWATGYDVAGLTDPGAADALFVMGYDYNWSGSGRAGGVAPIESPYTIDVKGTMSDFLAETSGSKLIWGVPYYGRTWHTASSMLNAKTVSGASKAYTYNGALADAQRYGRRWDDVGQVPWYRHWDSGAGNWVQGYYDDVQSLGAKYDLINARGLAGTGMWTLLMDQGRDELWQLLVDKFVHDTAPPVGGISLMPTSVDDTTVAVSWRGDDYASGIASYDVQVREAGGTWAPLLSGTTLTTTLYTGEAGTTYEFRARGRDRKGNVQAWVRYPARSASLQPGHFARVSTATLNVRSGAGTTYGAIGSASSGDWVYLLEGPVSASGYSWYRVQYGFSEWGSADYPEIGWMAAGDGSESYLASAASPNRTKLNGFVSVLSHTDVFSPNGDGSRDSASTDYHLLDPATNVSVAIVNESGTTVRTLNLGAAAAGDHTATWDGRVTGGAWAPEGRYLFRFTATDGGGGSHVAPSAALGAAAMDRWGVRADVTAPQASGDPGVGAGLVAARSRLVIDWSEPVYGAGGDAITLLGPGSTPLALKVANQSSRRRTTITPLEPMPVDAELTVQLSSDIRDAAGNPVATSGWTFTTAPGIVFEPSRQLVVTRGTQVAYRIGAGGALLDATSRWFGRTVTYKVAQRATLPNLPGRWLYVTTGPWKREWVRESPQTYLRGTTEMDRYPWKPRIVIRPGTRTGYRFTADGDVAARHTHRLSARTTANVSARAIINGRPYFRVVNGPWDNYWLPESGGVYRAGFLDERAFATPPQIVVAAGTHRAYRFWSSGARRHVRRVSLGAATVLHAEAFAVINGRAYLFIADGPFNGYWVREGNGISLKV